MKYIITIATILTVSIMAYGDYHASLTKQAIYKHTHGQLVCFRVPVNAFAILATDEYVRPIYR